MKTLTYLALAAALLPACTDPADDVDDNIEDSDGKADGTGPQITNDQLNGEWREKLDGHYQDDDLVIESWSAVGIRLHLGDKVVQLTRAGALLGELLAGGSLHKATGVGVGAWIGFLVGAVVKLGVCFAMLGIFAFAFLVG